MNIVEVEEMVNKSNMDTEVKAKICEILTLYRDIADLISGLEMRKIKMEKWEFEVENHVSDATFRCILQFH